MGPEPRSSSITGAADRSLAYTGRGLGAVENFNTDPTDRASIAVEAFAAPSG
jgi:hypothetical protein